MLNVLVLNRGSSTNLEITTVNGLLTRTSVFFSLTLYVTMLTLSEIVLRRAMYKHTALRCSCHSLDSLSAQLFTLFFYLLLRASLFLCYYTGLFEFCITPPSPDLNVHQFHLCGGGRVRRCVRRCVLCDLTRYPTISIFVSPPYFLA